MSVTLQPRDALLIADIQYDFLPGGALGIAHGDEVIGPANRYVAAAERAGIPVYASRDWHPADHCSFRARGGPWPEHCVAGTRGAEFSAEFKLPRDAVIISKATQRDAEAYSAFSGTDLEARLRKAQVTRLLIGGLATDYCVLNTVRDALALGFQVLVLQDAMRAVDVQPGDGVRAEAAMREAGATLIRIEDLQ